MFTTTNLMALAAIGALSPVSAESNHYSLKSMINDVFSGRKLQSVEDDSDVEFFDVVKLGGELCELDESDTQEDVSFLASTFAGFDLEGKTATTVYSKPTFHAVPQYVDPVMRPQRKKKKKKTKKKSMKSKGKPKAKATGKAKSAPKAKAKALVISNILHMFLYPFSLHDHL